MVPLPAPLGPQPPPNLERRAAVRSIALRMPPRVWVSNSAA